MTKIYGIPISTNVGASVVIEHPVYFTDHLKNGLQMIISSSDSTMTTGEREIVLTHVSYVNGSTFDYRLHRLIAAQLVSVDTIHEIFDNHHPPLSMRRVFDICNGVIKKSVSIEEVIAEGKFSGMSYKKVHEIISLSSFACAVNAYSKAIGLNSIDIPYEVLQSYSQKIIKHGY